jgi:hypothetical protein
VQETEQGTATADAGQALATVARDTFEYSLVPWAGRPFVSWLRGWARTHPIDPVGLVQLPESIYRAYQARTPGQRLTRKQAEELGYPHVPGEEELDKVRRELHEALGRCDWQRAHDLDEQLRSLQDTVASRRVTALRR